MPRADLHTHTTASDGRLSPPGLVEKAYLRGLAVLSVTDHDTLAAYPTAALAAGRYGIDLIPGVELSANVNGTDVHLLGYGFDLEDAGLRTHLARYRRERRERAEEIAARMATLGRPIRLERVLDLAAGGTVGRPHIARAIVEAGHAETVQGAFEQYIGNGAPAFVPKGKASAEELIALVHAAGGVCVLAHPGAWVQVRFAEHLASVGLDGIETVHPAHDDDLREHWRSVARRLGLFETGGSDYHGFHPRDDERFGRYTVPVARTVPLRRAA
ncbi:MAG: PHP domain-containing protein [Bacteroidota bacterium]